MTIALPDHHAGKSSVEHRATLHEAFDQIARDCVTCDVRPCGITVTSLFGQVAVRVQFSGSDPDAVDALAELYGFDPDDTTPKLNVFSRGGQLLVGDRLVQVAIFTGRPAAHMAVTA